MISLKNPGQIAKMREAGKILREVEDEVREHIRPGVSTAELDILAEKLIRKNGAIPSSLHYEGYPCSICASINDEVVHGIPSERRVLKDGDVISIDCTLLKDGWQADSAFTVGVGEISEEARKLIRVTEECFWKGVRQCIAGNRLGDVGHAIDTHARQNGFSVIREFTGHGIGKEMHEDPSVFNFGDPGRPHGREPPDRPGVLRSRPLLLRGGGGAAGQVFEGHGPEAAVPVHGVPGLRGGLQPGRRRQLRHGLRRPAGI